MRKSYPLRSKFIGGQRQLGQQEESEDPELEANSQTASTSGEKIKNLVVQFVEVELAAWFLVETRIYWHKTT